MSSRTIRNRVIGFIELADPAAPSETWDQLVEGSHRHNHSDSRRRPDGERGLARGTSRHEAPRIVADVVQLRRELDDEFDQLCLEHPELPVSHRAD
jgi:hypothetical protein